MNVTVVRKCSRRCKGELVGLILAQVAGGIERTAITSDCMRSITHICPDNLRSFFDRQRCRLKAVLTIFLNNLHLDSGRRLSGSWLRRRRCRCCRL